MTPGSGPRRLDWILSGQTADAIGDFAGRQDDPFVGRVGLVGKHDAERREVPGFEPEVHLQKAIQALAEESCANEQYHRGGEFQDDQP